ncbi:hypothetical protein SUDANB121_05885 (plasmid) [Nocardiopsis dassonvillei]|uniref:hypothetical protein n=1 Tax=Nocardiopsis dassonvillei TaxID=2014 RepID=UPI003F56C55C
MPGRLGPLLSAVQDALDRPGVQQHTVDGEWRIEFTEQALVAWLAEQRALSRAEALAGRMPEDHQGQDERTGVEPAEAKHTAEAATHARDALRVLLVELVQAGNRTVGISDITRHLRQRGIDRGRSWAYNQFNRMASAGLVRHDQDEGTWTLLDALLTDQDHPDKGGRTVGEHGNVSAASTKVSATHGDGHHR